jgi:SagB-type dehydrogenase family enzyme
MSSRQIDLIRKALNRQDFDILRKLHILTNNFSLPKKNRKSNTNEILYLNYSDEDIRYLETNEIQLSDVPIRTEKILPSTITILERNKSSIAFIKSSQIKFSLLSDLLFNSFSHINKIRPYPSGGSLYSNVILLVVLKKIDEVLSPGEVYQYLPEKAQLDQLSHLPVEAIQDAMWLQGNPLSNADFLILYAMIPEKVFFKYKFRGYRLALMEIGSMYQCATLVASQLKISNRVWSAFNDYEVAKLLGIDTRVVWPAIIHFFGIEDTEI